MNESSDFHPKDLVNSFVPEVTMNITQKIMGELETYQLVDLMSAVRKIHVAMRERHFLTQCHSRLGFDTQPTLH
jgi:hypothetical protein